MGMLEQMPVGTTITKTTDGYSVTIGSAHAEDKYLVKALNSVLRQLKKDAYG
jgi:hypothetical protein